MVDVYAIFFIFVIQAGELERIEQEINLSLHSMGVSLVNDTTQTEVAYLGITRYLSIYQGCLSWNYKVLHVIVYQPHVVYSGISYGFMPPSCFIYSSIYPDLSTFGFVVTPSTFKID